MPSGSFYVAEDGARDITGRSSLRASAMTWCRWAVWTRPRAVEGLAWLLVAAMNDGVPVFYRLAVPGEL